jgi:hypothetical protein
VPIASCAGTLSTQLQQLQPHEAADSMPGWCGHWLHCQAHTPTSVLPVAHSMLMMYILPHQACVHFTLGISLVTTALQKSENKEVVRSSAVRRLAQGSRANARRHTQPHVAFLSCCITCHRLQRNCCILVLALCSV